MAKLLYRLERLPKGCEDTSFEIDGEDSRLLLDQQAAVWRPGDRAATTGWRCCVVWRSWLDPDGTERHAYAVYELELLSDTVVSPGVPVLVLSALGLVGESDDALRSAIDAVTIDRLQTASQTTASR